MKSEASGYFFWIGSNKNHSVQSENKVAEYFGFSEEYQLWP